jgi:hypothetical protein
MRDSISARLIARTQYSATKLSPVKRPSRKVGNCSIRLRGHIPRRQSIQSAFAQDGHFNLPDITYAAIRGNTLRRTITCPMCGKQFSLPSGWTKPPFRCPECQEHLQATVRYSNLNGYLWWIFAPLSLLVGINRGWVSYVIFSFGFLVICAVIGVVSAALFPLDVTRYEPEVTAINLTK